MLLRDAGLKKHKHRHIIVAALITLSLFGFYRGVVLWQQIPKSQILASSPFTREIKQHIPANTLIINNKWSHFQELVWLLPDYRFANGLDGHYLLYRSPEKFALWQQLSGAEGPQIPDFFQKLKQAFDSPWLLMQKSSKTIDSALDAAYKAEDVTLIMENSSLALFYIGQANSESVDDQAEQK